MFRSFTSAPWLSLLAVLALSLGVSTVTSVSLAMKSLTESPLGRDGQLIYHVQLDPRPLAGYNGGQAYSEGVLPPDALTWTDVQSLLRGDPAGLKVASTLGQLILRPLGQGASAPASIVNARYTSAGFFEMFGLDFLAGSAWSSQDDLDNAQVAVIGIDLAKKTFGRINPIGALIQLDGHSFRIVGVVKKWNPKPKFYDLASSGFAENEDLFVPLTSAVADSLGRNGPVECWGAAAADLRNAPCTWIQYWVRLRSPEQIADYRSYLWNYSEEERKAGRFERPPNIGLYSVQDWIHRSGIIPMELRVQSMISLGFFIVCLMNVSGLMFVIFLRRRREIGIRRALGAKRVDIFAQLIRQSMAIGSSGSLLGTLLTWLFCRMLLQSYFSRGANEIFYHPYLYMFLIVSLFLTALSSVPSALRACLVAPAEAIKNV